MSEAVDVHSNDEHKARRRDLDAQDRQAEAAEERKQRANRDFAQVYPKGWRRIRSLMKRWPLAADLYAFLAEHLDPSVGAVVASQELLAGEMRCSVRQLRRVAKWLEEDAAIVRIRVGTGVYAYALDPDEVWKSWADAKDVAAFHTKTLARKSDNGAVKRRLKTMMGEPELPFDPDDHEAT